MSNDGTVLTEGDILAHAVEAVDRVHWAQVGAILSRLELPSRDLDRVDELLEKNRGGQITEHERIELERYLRVGSFLDLLRARALREISQAS